jgi:hypothetical protein
MYVSQFLGLVAAALLSTTVLGSPLSVPEENALLDRRASYNCGGQTYTSAQAQDGFGDAIRHRQANSLVGRYPTEFRNGNAKSPEVDASPCAGMQLYEFPILHTGAQYTGGAPGPDRVVVADSNSSPGSYVQCFLMTHTGASGNLFKKCT